MKQSPFGTSSHIVSTVCPLDCPDCCSLDVTVQDGKVTVDRRLARQPGDGWLHLREGPPLPRARVRRRSPAVPGRAQGTRKATRASSASRGTRRSTSSPTRMRETRDRWGGEAILPYSYGGSNGLLTQDTSDATLFRRLGASRLARTVCAAADRRGQPGALRQDAVGHLRGLPRSPVHPAVGREPVVVRHPPRSLHPRGAEARRACWSWSIRVTTPLAKRADVHLAVRPGTDLPVALAIHRYLFEDGFADQAFLDAHTHGAERLREQAQAWTIERAAAEAGIAREALARVAAPVRHDVAGARQVRLGPGAQPQRRQLVDGHPGAAGGGRQVRRARRRLHDEQHERVGPGAHVDSRPGARHAPGEHEPSGPGADRVPRPARRSCCSSTTRTRRSHRRIRRRS